MTGTGDRQSADRCCEEVNHRQRVRMLTFHKLDGSSYSASYSHLQGVHATGHGLRLEFSRAVVVVTGEGLWQVREALADHRVMYLKASTTEPKHGGPWIQRIEVLGESSLPNALGKRRTPDQPRNHL